MIFFGDKGTNQLEVETDNFATAKNQHGKISIRQ
jgi:hypothetical protein